VLSGPPPEDSDRRCTAMRRCGLQCKRWALKGIDVCQFHGGKKPRYYWTQHVSRFYKRSLGESLEAVLRESLEHSPDEQITLFEELALMRETANQHVKIYSAALATEKQDTIMTAAELMAMSLQRVAEMCKAASAVHNQQKEKFSVHDLNYVIEQIIRISHDVFNGLPQVNEFAMRIRDELQLSSNNGTTITPDQDVLGMDEATLG
jgi:hypothetical protein